MSTTTAHSGQVAHHFDDAEQQYVAAELGMWLFLATEVLFFGGLFLLYTTYRYWYPAEFIAASHHLDVWLGTFNTAILLSSSLTMVLAVHAAQTNWRRGQVMFLVLTVLLGSVFLGVKAYEYHHKFEERLVPGANFQVPHEASRTEESEASGAGHPTTGHAGRNMELFFSLYFAMTGLHAIHMVIGIVILLILTVAAARGVFSGDYYTPIEMSGLYWHFVDIVWVFLFPLLYLIR